MVRATFNEPFAVTPYTGPYGGMHDGRKASPKNMKTAAGRKMPI